MQLPAISDDQGLFSVLAFDEVSQLSQLLQLDLSLADNLEFLNQVLVLLLELSPEVSALVLDPIYTLPLITHKTADQGVLLRINTHQAVAAEQLPALFPHFSLPEVKNNYALAKLDLNYIVDDQQAIEKLQLLAEIHDYCQTLGIDFLLKLTGPFTSEEQLLATLQQVRSLTDIVVLNQIDNPLLAATITSELDIPWLLSANLGQDLDYEQFKNQLRLAMDNGAKGYYLGNFLWADLAQARQAEQTFDWQQMQQLLRTTIRDRVIELGRIISRS